MRYKGEFMNQKLVQYGLLGLTVVAGAVVWGVIPAIVIIMMIYFHEIGHQQTARFFGAKTGGIYMIPFVGGVAVTEGYLPRFEKSVVYLGGPFFGLIYSVVVIMIGEYFNLPEISELGGVCAFVNCFNLLPIFPLDGGGILKEVTFSLSKKLGFAVMLCSIALSIALFIKFMSPIFAIIAFLGYVGYNEEKVGTTRYSDMKISETLAILFLWAVLQGLLIATFICGLST